MSVLIGGERLDRYDAALRDLYVDSDGGGDDTAAGDVGNPLATIQEAINRFLPAWLGVQSWDHNDNRVIHVVGSGTITEEVVVPDFAGQGILHFEFEEEVVEAGLQLSGSPVGVAGFEVTERVSFDTSPLTPSTLGDNSFYRPDAAAKAAAGYVDAIEETFEDVAIVDNAAGSIDVVADDGLTIFGYVLGADGDIVRPQITWTPDSFTGSSFADAVAIKSGKGRILVTGCAFDFERFTDAAAQPGDVGLGGGTQPFTLARCTFENQGGFGNNGHIRGFGAGIHACIDLAPPGSPGNFVDISILMNNTRIVGGHRFTEGRCDLFCVSAGDTLTFEGEYVGFIAVDVRGGIAAGLDYESRSDGTSQSPFAVSFGAAVSNLCVQVNENSHVRLSGTARAQGSGSFAGVGVYRRSIVEVSGAASLPYGPNIQTGNLAPVALTSVAVSGNQTDTAGDRGMYYRIS